MAQAPATLPLNENGKRRAESAFDVLEPDAPSTKLPSVIDPASPPCRAAEAGGDSAEERQEPPSSEAEEASPKVASRPTSLSPAFDMPPYDGVSGVYKLRIDPLLVGRVIGSRGEARCCTRTRLCSLALTAFAQTIRTMQAVSGAHIDIDQQVPMGCARIVTVSGPPGAIHACRSLLDDLLRTPVAAHPGQVTVPPGGLERIVLCSKQLVGRIIGRQGGIVKGLQAITGARIQIDQSTEPCRVSITGAPECAEACFRIVSDIAAGGHSAQYSYSAYMARTAQGAWAQTGHGVPATGAYGGGAYAHTPSFSYGGAQFYGLQPPFAPQQTQGGWQAALDGQGRVYWFNAVTGMSQWEKPEGVP